MPKSTSTERGGRPQARVWLTPQPPAGSTGGGGWRQAGFHPVNYSVARSAPQRGGGREGESEPPTAPRNQGSGRNQAPLRSREPCGRTGRAEGHLATAPRPSCLQGLPAPCSLPTGCPGTPAGRRTEDGAQSAGARPPAQAWRAAGMGQSRGQQECPVWPDAPGAPGAAWSCGADKEPPQGQPCLRPVGAEPPARMWQSQHTEFPGSPELVPPHGSPPRARPLERGGGVL